MQGVDCRQEPCGPYRCLLSTSSILNLYQQYSYQVAAVNIYGAGPFSEPVYATGSEFVNQTHIFFGRLNIQLNKTKHELLVTTH